MLHQDLLCSIGTGNWGQKSEQSPERIVYHRSGDEAGGLDLEEWRESEGLSLPRCLAGLYVSMTGWPWQFPGNACWH